MNKSPHVYRAEKKTFAIIAAILFSLVLTTRIAVMIHTICAGNILYHDMPILSVLKFIKDHTYHQIFCFCTAFIIFSYVNLGKNFALGAFCFVHITFLLDYSSVFLFEMFDNSVRFDMWKNITYLLLNFLLHFVIYLTIYFITGYLYKQKTEKFPKNRVMIYASVFNIIPELVTFILRMILIDSGEIKFSYVFRDISGMLISLVLVFILLRIFYALFSLLCRAPSGK